MGLDEDRAVGHHLVYRFHGDKMPRFGAFTPFYTCMLYRAKARRLRWLQESRCDCFQVRLFGTYLRQLRWSPRRDRV